jgi:shikimate dehydrogenase
LGAPFSYFPFYRFIFISMNINHTNWTNFSSPIICGLLAENASSYGRVLHNAGFDALRIPFTYHAFNVRDVETPLNAMRAMGFRGYSVTIPFKEQVIPLLDVMDPVAREIGAVNTIVNTGEALIGYNTDWIGVREAFKEVMSDFCAESCLVLGAGGAAKAAIFAMKQLGVKKITVINRTEEKARVLSDTCNISMLSLDSLSPEALQSFSIIINTTPGSTLSYFPYDALTSAHTVLEMVNATTGLSMFSQSKGATLISGIRMLLHQGLEQFRLFTEKEPPQSIMEKALLDEFKAKNPSLHIVK